MFMGQKRYRVTIENTGESYLCGGEDSVLAAMVRLGYKGIPSGCHGGGCGICKVEVLSGDVETRSMSRAHVSAVEEEQGIALACRLFPLTDVTVRVHGCIKKGEAQPQRRYGFV